MVGICPGGNFALGGYCPLGICPGVIVRGGGGGICPDAKISLVLFIYDGV